jgi:adenylate cyclase
MLNNKSSFDLKSWYEQMAAEKQRLETELGRVSKLVEALDSFVIEEETSNTRVGFPEVASSEFEQLATLNKKIQLLYFLLDVIRSLSSESDTNRRAALIIDKAAQLINADRGALFLLDETSNLLCAKVKESQGVKEMKFPRNIGIVGYVANSGRTINITDATKDHRFDPEIDEKPAYHATNMVATPLRDSAGNIFGVLQVLNKNDGKFGADDEHLLQAFAAQASVALSDTQPKVDSSMPVSNTMLLIMKALAAGLDTDSLLQSLMKKTTQVMDADRSTLFLIDFARHELWSKVAEGTGISEIRFPIDRGISGYVVSTGQMVNIPDAYEDPRFNPEIDSKTGYHTRSILCAPLKDESGKIIGALQVLNKKSGIFTTQDEKLITSFAFQVSKVLKSSNFLLSLLSIIEAERVPT